MRVFAEPVRHARDVVADHAMQPLGLDAALIALRQELWPGDVCLEQVANKLFGLFVLLGVDANERRAFVEGHDVDLLAGLDDIVRLHEAGEFAISPADEDCHTAIENFLTARCGEAGKKIHTARSRNDQVLTALRLYEKDVVAGLIVAINELVAAVDAQRSESGDVAMPGFTHTRKAMPTTAGAWFAAFAAALKDDALVVGEWIS